MPRLIDQSSQRLLMPPYHNINLLAWPAGQSMDWHQHNFLQFIHILDGWLEVDWGAGWQRINPHQLHILPPQHRHRLRSPAGHRQFGINFNTQSDERGFLQTLLSCYRQPCIQSCNNPLIEDVMHKHIHVQLAAIDGYCARLINITSDPETIQQQQLLAVIDQHLHQSSDVNAWAMQLHMSRASIQRHAHDAFGCGLATLHEQRRMQKSADHLLRTTDSIAATAEHFGFADATSFGRAFKRHFKMSPGQWRDAARQRGG